jgi:hypothetical protein
MNLIPYPGFPPAWGSGELFTTYPPLHPTLSPSGDWLPSGLGLGCNTQRNLSRPSGREGCLTLVGSAQGTGLGGGEASLLSWVPDPWVLLALSAKVELGSRTRAQIE